MLWRIVLFIFGTFACTSRPPDSVAIQRDMPPERQEIVIDGINEWCEKVNWCPSVVIGDVTDAEGYVIQLANYEQVKSNGSSGFTRDEWLIALDAKIPNWLFKCVVLHELGHYGIDTHAPEKWSLMNEMPDWSEDTECVIDEPSRNLWCDEQGTC